MNIAHRIESAVPAKPFLKYAGGKSRLLPTLFPLTPPDWNAYHEPFVGGGAFFFALEKQRVASLADMNPELVSAYQAISDNVESVIAVLENSGWENTRECFARVRELALTKPETVAARMIWLNRHCFNGLYRVNKRGRFNVPFGKYKTVTIDVENLRACARLLQGVEVWQADFADTLALCQRGDFVYLDPPYPPASKTADFVSYTSDKFSAKEHERLADTFLDLRRKGVRAMLSIADVPLARVLYGSPGSSGRVRVVECEALRSISCKASTRAPARELVILNYNEEGACF